MLYISMKFHENILNGFQVIEWTRFCDRQTNGQTYNQGKNNLSLPFQGEGDIMKTYVEGTH